MSELRQHQRGDSRMLSHLGLDDMSEDVYRRLVSTGPSRRDALAASLGCSMDELETAFGRLTELGLVTPTPAGEGLVTPTPPDVALGAIITRQRHELVQAEQAMLRLADDFHVHRHTQPRQQNVEIVRGAAAIGQRLGQIQGGARSDVR